MSGARKAAQNAAQNASRPDFGSWLRAIRHEMNLRQDDVALELGATKSLISRFEHGTAQPTDRHLRALPEILRVEPDVVYEAAGRIPPDIEAALIFGGREAFETTRAVIRALASPDKR